MTIGHKKIVGPAVKVKLYSLFAGLRHRGTEPGMASQPVYGHIQQRHTFKQDYLAIPTSHFGGLSAEVE